MHDFLGLDVFRHVIPLDTPPSLIDNPSRINVVNGRSDDFMCFYT